jgi:hypothetical protein
LNVDKVLAGQARSLEHVLMVGGIHHSETVLVVVDKPGETRTSPCGQALVVDEDLIMHAQLGGDNLLIIPGTTAGELEVEADHFVLVLGKQLLHIIDLSLHRDRLIGTRGPCPSRGCPLREAW